MISVNVATLKEKLSYYLKLVKEGKEVVVTSHRHKVARLLPASAPDSQPSKPRRPAKDLLRIKGVKLKPSVSAVRALLEDRQRR